MYVHSCNNVTALSIQYPRWVDTHAIMLLHFSNHNNLLSNDTQTKNQFFNKHIIRNNNNSINTYLKPYLVHTITINRVNLTNTKKKNTQIRRKRRIKVEDDTIKNKLMLKWCWLLHLSPKVSSKIHINMKRQKSKLEICEKHVSTCKNF